MSHDGERFVPHESNTREISVNVSRYLYALRFCEGKKVLDIGAGSGLGTYLYGLTASSVVAVDYNQTALDRVVAYPHVPGKVSVLKADIEKDVLPDAEVAVALEVIEHISNPDWFLGQLKVDRLVFSVPLNSLAISEWHKYDFRSVQDVERLISRYFTVEELSLQESIWVVGTAVKKI